MKNKDIEFHAHWSITCLIRTLNRKAFVFAHAFKTFIVNDQKIFIELIRK